MDERCVAVCAPTTQGRELMANGDFCQASLLQLSSRLGDWEDWMAQAGIDKKPANTVAGHRFDLFSMLVEAVRADLGIGLVPRYLVARELAAGELVLAHAHVGVGPRGYSVFVAPHKAQDPMTMTFVRWLHAAVDAI
jgi:DNA-binding transcriptional LysR family regulator